MKNINTINKKKKGGRDQEDAGSFICLASKTRASS